jgi:two-component system, cell cycle sensor histidine kinase and response regulator CckA
MRFPRGLQQRVHHLGVVFLVLVGMALQAAPHRKVRVAVFPFLPGIFMGQDGKPQGFYVDMLREVGARENWELEFVPGSWAEGLDRAKRHEVDLLTSVAFTPERSAFLDYGKESSFTVWSILYAHPKERIQSVLDVRGLRVAVMRNDMNGAHFRELCAKFNIPCEFVEVESFIDVMAAVEAGRANAGVTVNTFGYARERGYRVVRTPVVFNPFDIFFAVPKGHNADCLTALDAYLKAGKAQDNSSYQQAINRWLHSTNKGYLPLWVVRTGALVLILLGTSWIVVWVFRRRVQAATARIQNLNAELERELAERQRQAELIFQVAIGVSSAMGERGLEDLVRFLAQVAKADLVVLGERIQVQEAPWIRALAVYQDGAQGSVVEYPLAGSPCEQVLQGELCVVSEGLQARFPQSDQLQALGMESFVGAPLVDASGQVLGNLAVMYRLPLEHGDEVPLLLRIFASRAGAELERRRNEVERHGLERQMQHTQKLESLGVLAGGIAHDFNNLLTAMLGHLNVAQTKLSKTSPAQPHLENLERILHRTADLTRQMLAYSGKGRFVVKPHDLNAVIREMVHLLEVSISKKVALHLNLKKTLPPIEADVTQIQQVIMNLVTNASDAIGDRNGAIHITTSVQMLDEVFLNQVFQHQDMKPGPHVLLEVGDSGCGMSAEVLARIFDPFFTTKVSGRGLGLSATMGILKGHKAGIKIYSEPERGTTFKLYFPALAETELPQVQAQVGMDELPKATVLLVDDEDFIREAGMAMLEALGMEVVLAANGEEAIGRIQVADPSIDLVVMDLTMPQMDGREAFLILRNLRPDLPVILSSGYSEQESIPDLVGQGLAGFIQKPYTLQAMRAKLREVLAR